MNEDELRLLLDGLEKTTSVFNHLFTHLKSFVSFSSWDTFKMYKMTWKDDDDAWSRKKADDETNGEGLVFVLVDTDMTVPAVKRPWTQMVSLLWVFQPGLSTRLMMFTASEDSYNIRKVGITEKHNKAWFALDNHHAIINELPSNLAEHISQR